MSDTDKIIASYGRWPSPITPQLLSASTNALQEVLVHQENGMIYWIESRPLEGGRYTIMEFDGSCSREVLPKKFSAHATVNELGGGTFAAIPGGGKIIFSDDVTKNVYSLDPKTTGTELVLEAEKGLRYGDFTVHPSQPDWVVAVMEDHREATPVTQAYGVHNTLVAINRRSKTYQTIASGDDFYAYARFSPDGTRICWVQWSHPDMPWTGSVLFVGEWNDEKGTIHNVEEVAGVRKEVSISQPTWSPDGTLYFANDVSGYWQMHSYSPTTKKSEPIVIKGLEKSEFAKADWRMASSTYIFLDPQTIVASCVSFAASNIFLIDLPSRTSHDLQLPYTDLAMHSTGIFRHSDTSFVVLGSTSTSFKSVDLVSDIGKTSSTKIQTIQTTLQTSIPKTYFSQAIHLQIPRSSSSTSSDPQTQIHTHAFLFPPCSATHRGPPSTSSPSSPPIPDPSSPCLIHLHGGPNGLTPPSLDLSTQFFTSRGYSVCSVNYSGSVGFGRSYRESLQWGLTDVLDVRDVVLFLQGGGGQEDKNNKKRQRKIGIYGGSAGGYGTLSAIHMFPEDFGDAAASLYGISDVKALQGDSYKFEGWDVERLIFGPEGVRERTRDEEEEEEGYENQKEKREEKRERLYKERSPRFWVSKVKAPLLLLQGTEDVAVPREQSWMMVREMEGQGKEVRIVEFEGEGHGWLKGESIERSFGELEGWWGRWLLDD